MNVSRHESWLSRCERLGDASVRIGELGPKLESNQRCVVVSSTGDAQEETEYLVAILVKYRFRQSWDQDVH